jgi:phosphoglycerate dehydrogenase-like enzyme
VRGQIVCDGGEVVAGIVRFVVSRRRSLRLLREADIVSLNCTLNPSSFHLIDSSALGAMKRGGFLINTCRGPVVDEQALEDALADGRLAGAALDVFEVEPLLAASRLRSLRNCFLAPHNANSSVSAAERVHENTIRALLEGLARPAQRPVAV